jgi:hypothetical protein
LRGPRPARDGRNCRLPAPGRHVERASPRGRRRPPRPPSHPRRSPRPPRASGDRCARSDGGVQAVGRLGWAYASTKERPAPPKTAPLARRRGWAAGPAPGVRAPARGRRLAGRGGCRAGRGGRQPRPERVSVPRCLRRRHRRQGPAVAHSRHHAKSQQNRTDRASTDARPRLQPPRPYSRFLARPIPASLGVVSMVDPPVSNPTPIHASPPPLPRCRRPAPGPPTPAWANPPHVYLTGRGRGVRREAADPPSSQAQAGSGTWGGGGAAACCAQGRNP